MTVAELIEELKKYDPTLEVWTEGCDCTGVAGEPEVSTEWKYTREQHHGFPVEVLLITRADED